MTTLQATLSSTETNSRPMMQKIAVVAAMFCSMVGLIMMTLTSTTIKPRVEQFLKS